MTIFTKHIESMLFLTACITLSVRVPSLYVEIWRLQTSDSDV